MIRVSLLIASSLLSIFLGFIFVEPEDAISLVRKYGYWGILVTFGLYAWLLFQQGCDHLRIDIKKTGSLAKSHSLDILLLAGLWICLVAHEALAFKIIMDEINLVGTSWSMHLERTVQSPLRAFEINGSFLPLGSFVDKRPYFFPFLVSIIHDFTGYRPENAFYLNNALLAVTLIATYFLGFQIGGKPSARLAVLAIGSVPLLSQVGNGAGFELLNILMIVAFTSHAILYLRNPCFRTQALMLLSVILLSQVRYESALFILPAIAVLAIEILKSRRLLISNTMITAPILLLPVPFLYNVFKLSEKSWQLDSKPEYSEPFAVANISQNLSDALLFYFDSAAEFPSSPILAVVGLIALIATSVWYFTRRFNKEHAIDASLDALIIAQASLVGLFLLLMAYFWGQFTDPVVRRLSLPTFLIFSLSIALLSKITRETRWVTPLLGILLFIGFWTTSLPRMSQNLITSEYLPGRHIAWRQEFIDTQPDKNFFMIDVPGFWLVNGIPAMSHSRAEDNIRKLEFLHRNRYVREIYVYQRFTRNLVESNIVISEDAHNVPSIELETVAERSLGPLSFARISKVTKINVESQLEFPFEYLLNGGDITGAEINKAEVLKQWSAMIP